MDLRYVKFYKQEEIVTLEELSKHPEKYSISLINIATNPRVDNTIYEKTDADHPLILEDGQYLLINEDYYYNNQEKINRLINTLCKNTPASEMILSKKDFITDDTITALSQNNNLKTISLTPSFKENEETYTLSPKDYNTFRTSSTPKEVITKKVAPELEDVFDPIIHYNCHKPLIGTENYDTINKLQKLRITKELTDKDIENLRYLPPNTIIVINITNYNNIEKILNRLLELNKDYQILLTNIPNKEEFNQTPIYQNIEKYQKLNIKLKYDDNVDISNFISLKEYKHFEEILYLFVKPALERNYSPFEKYIYAYNIAKKFKAYKEDKNNSNSSRDLYSILINEYMVCVGYSKLFRDLLSKLGIKETIEKRAEVTINSPGENIFNQKGELNTSGHSRAYTHIKDDKYGIDGFYIADPTWDNNLTHDLYIFLAVTNREMDYCFRVVKQNYLDTIFDVTTIEEFYEAFTTVFNHRLLSSINIEKYLKKKTPLQYLKINNYEGSIEMLLDIIKELDSQAYQEIMNKFEFEEVTSIFGSSTHRKLKNENDIPNVIEYLGRYIVSKVNKPIPGEVIIAATTKVNKDVLNLTDTQAQEYANMLIETNKKMQEIEFPPRQIKNERTGEIIMENTENKFAFNQSPSHTK